MYGNYPIFIKKVDPSTAFVLDFVSKKVKLVKNGTILKEFKFDSETKVSTLEEKIKQFLNL